MEATPQKVMLTEIYTVPKLPKITTGSTQKSPQSTYKLTASSLISPRKQHSSNISAMCQNMNNKSQELTNNNKSNQYKNRIINDHFKDKIYEDITTEYLTKLKHKLAFEDESISNRVLHMKKFIYFWKSFCDYANPILSIEKFKYAEKEINQRCNTEANEIDMTPRHPYKPILYTNSSINQLRHQMKKEKEKEFYRKLRLKKYLI